MAHLHYKRTRYRVGSRNAGERIAYITGQTRTAQDPATRQLTYISKGREDLVAEGSRNLPAWAGGNPHTYFQAAEQYERKNGVAFEEWKIMLPQELTHAHNQALISDLLDTIAGDRLPCTYAFHAPPTLDARKEQPHIHLLISARETDGIPRSASEHFRRWNAADPGRGGAQKDPQMNVYHATKFHRLMISDILNVHLELHGQVARVHPDSLESRGIDRKPEPKLLPSESAAFRETGEISATMAEVLAIREARAQQPPAEQNQARQYWERRSRFLGLSRDMAREAKVERIAALRHGTPLPPPQRIARPTPTQTITPDALTKRWATPIIGNTKSGIYHVPTHKNYGDVGPHNQVRFWTEQEAIAAGYRRARNEVGIGASAGMEAGTPGERSDRSPARAVSVLATLRASRGTRAGGQDREEEGGRPKKMRVRLQEEERLGWG